MTVRAYAACLLCASATSLAATALTATAVAAETSLVSAKAEQATPAIDLFEAVEQGVVDMKYIAKSDRRARVILTNNTDKQVNLQMPEAFAGVPALAQFGGGGGGLGGGGGGLGGGGGGQQAGGGGFGGGGGGLGGGGGGQFSIPPEKTCKIEVATVCLEHGKRDPSSSKPYEMIPVDEFVDRPAVIELLKAFGRGELDHGAAQAAVWALNNDMTWEELAAKQTGTVRSGNRQPYFTRQQIFAAMAYAKEAVRRAELAEQREESDESMSDEPAENEVGETKVGSESDEEADPTEDVSGASVS